MRDHFTNENLIPTDTPQYYFQKAQMWRRTDDSLFIPSNYGVLIRADKPPMIISNHKDDKTGALTLWEIHAKMNRLETNGIIYCGVLTAKSDSSKLLIHAFSPTDLKHILAVANQINGRDVLNDSELRLSFNPNEQNKDKEGTFIDIIPNAVFKEIKTAQDWVDV